MSARARGTVLAVTGTSTDVGKTVVTAALAAAGGTTAPADAVPDPRPTTVAVCKPVQTGVGPDAPGDLAEIVRLAGDVTTVESFRYPEPLAPDTAARRAGMPPADPDVIVREVERLAATHDLTLVEGAGGVLVRLGETATILDVAVATLRRDTADGVIVVVAPGLGALNHAELTVNAVRARGLRPAGLVIGSWPENPDLAMRCNRTDLPRVTGVPVVGVLPAGAAALDPAEFRRLAPTWFDHDWLAGTLPNRPEQLVRTS
ncbi:ATP-dependent dethiobiotin synthetase BioD [Gordonia jinghuaiqii]|uniref:ATP-dependent dethiobiotin synthetase BioD n=1 Tax=Gordonia jinghuaiqii TaxID=2758710 RepID=A0A7D7LW45_9ACTN|nr:dethiobiotin synthase [Gordonia jinghuaiqii]MCR5977299.1 ATP-dependent dethiobiotin synthetase BioD [Gordonia jinghuaiqii]QMT00114.1 ATP-dependent dethiobiotin synthetase BioD [Gordonia jinghuaiqii]